MLVKTPGALTLESGTGMCRGHDPFFQASRRSLNLLSVRRSCAPYHLNFKENFAFLALFWPEFQLSRRKFSKCSFPRPLFFFLRKNQLPKPYI